MATPEKLPTWATDAVFASPGDPWDGDPTKVEPPAGKLAEGWEPTEEPPAEFLNWWKNLVGRWIEEVARRSVRTLVPSAFNPTGVWPGAGFSPQRIIFDGWYWYACGPSGASGGTVRSRSAGQLEAWIAPTVAAGAGSQECLASDGAGFASSTVLSGGVGGEIVRSTDSGANWAIAEAAGSISALSMTAMVWSPSNALFVAFTTSEIFTSPTGATGTWVSRTVPVGVGGQGSQTNPTTILSGPSAGRVLYPVHNGVIYSDDCKTWTFQQILTWTTGVSQGSDVRWTEGDGGYLLATNLQGDIARSSDGTSWTSVATDVLSGLANAAGADPYPSGSALSFLTSNLGGTWLAIGTTIGTDRRTYVYSIDGGATWEVGPYEDIGSAQAVCYANGRFVIGSATAAPEFGQVWVTATDGS